MKEISLTINQIDNYATTCFGAKAFVLKDNLIELELFINQKTKTK